MKKAQAASAEYAVEAAKNAQRGPLTPPDHVKLGDAEMLFWDDIVCARPRGQWLRVDLVVAAQLARCQCDIERESQALRDEGTVIKNFRDTPIANPRVSVLEQLARREMALMRSLRIAGVVMGDPRKTSAQLQREHAANEVKKQLDDEEDDLLNGGEPALPAAETV